MVIMSDLFVGLLNWSLLGEIWIQRPYNLPLALLPSNHWRRPTWLPDWKSSWTSNVLLPPYNCVFTIYSRIRLHLIEYSFYFINYSVFFFHIHIRSGTMISVNIFPPLLQLNKGNWFWEMTPIAGLIYTFLSFRLLICAFTSSVLWRFQH